MQLLPQSVRQYYESVPTTTSTSTSTSTKHLSKVSIIAIASLILGTIFYYGGPAIDPDLLQQAFSYIPGPEALNRMLTDKTVQDILHNERPLGVSSHPSTFLLGIFSMDSEKEKERRQLIRETMLGIEDERVCSLQQYMAYAKKNGGYAKQNCISPYVFVIAAGGEDRPTEHDDDQPIVLDPSTIPHAEPDCIYLNIKENMENGKSVTYFKYGASIADEYQIDYFGKSDSDSLIHMPTYLNWIMMDLAPKPFNRRTYGGATWGNHEKSAIYAAGQFYFLSSDLAEWVSVIMKPETRRQLTNKRPFEDLDIGTFVYAHPRPIKFITLSQYMFWAHPRKEKETWMITWNEGMTKYPKRAAMMPFSTLCPLFGYEK